MKSRPKRLRRCSEIDDWKHCSKRVRRSHEIDRLSSLPDSVIRHILSLTDAKSAVQTCLLSKKWKFQWAYVPCYTFEFSTFKTPDDLENFVDCLLNNRKAFSISKPFICFKGATMESVTRLFCRYGILYRYEEIDIRKKADICNHKVVDRLSSLPDPLISHILSLMETKYAVQTSILSKRWRRQWTDVHSLNFNRNRFNRWRDFNNFVTFVLHNRRSIDLRKLEFYCGGTIGVNLVSSLFQYSISHGIEELETDVLGRFSESLSECKTKLYQCKTLKAIGCDGTISHIDFGQFLALRSLRMTEVVIPSLTDVFCNCTHLESLVLEKCSSASDDSIRISAPNIISLTVISDNRCCYNIEMATPRLKSFHLNGPPCRLTFRVANILDELNIETTPSAYSYYARRLKEMVEGLCCAKSVSVLVNLPTARYLTTYDAIYSEVKVTKLNKVPEKNQLVSSYYMMNGLKLSKLATILVLLPLDERRPMESICTDVDRFSNLPDPIIHHILSLVDTKTAVKTSILSKKLRNHWKNIHSINLQHNFSSVRKFRQVLNKVMQDREPSNLIKLNLHLTDHGNPSLANAVAKWALKSDLQELNTNITVLPTTLRKYQTLKTLKIGPNPNTLITIFPDISAFPSLTTLLLGNFLLPSSDLFADCKVLEHLTLIECLVSCGSNLIVSAPKLVTLVLERINGLHKADWGDCGTLSLRSPMLKSFRFQNNFPLSVKVVDSPLLENVFFELIPLFMKPYCKYAEHFIDSVVITSKAFYQVKSFTLCLNFNQETFILCRGSVGGQMKLVEMNRVTRERNLIGLVTM